MPSPELAIRAPMPRPERLVVVDVLRGLAAFSVCWFHLTAAVASFWPAGAFIQASWVGRWGIYIFFVISGFILPHALFTAGYQLRDYGRFVLKRVLRLDPPYLSAVLLALIINRVSAAWAGSHTEVISTSWQQVVLHVAYLNCFTSYPWLVVAFWSLAVEFQFYLIFGLMFPLLVHRRVVVRAALFAVLGAVAVLSPSIAFVLHWFFFFLLGFAVFQFRAGLLSKKRFLLLGAVLVAGAGYTEGIGGAIAGGAAALAIAFTAPRAREPFATLGRISYSLYLIHQPIGVRVLNLGLRFGSSLPWKIFLLGVALGSCLVAAWLLHHFVEVPALRLSSRIRLGRRAGTRYRGAVEALPMPQGRLESDPRS